MRRTASERVWGAGALLLLGLAAIPAHAHQGPPFPVVQDRVTGAYTLSIWTDPDVTDDGTAAGKFWVIVHAASGAEVDSHTRVTLAAHPVDREGATQGAAAAPEHGAPSRYFAALVFNHEGDWQVDAVVEGPLGRATTSTQVTATYDLRPPVSTLPFLLLPFLLVGFLWLKALRTRRQRRSR